MIISRVYEAWKLDLDVFKIIETPLTNENDRFSDSKNKGWILPGEFVHDTINYGLGLSWHPYKENDNVLK